MPPLAVVALNVGRMMISTRSDGAAYVKSALQAIARSVAERRTTKVDEGGVIKSSLVFDAGLNYLHDMETATVIDEGDGQTVRLPKGYHLPTPTVQVRHEGDAVVLEPLKPRVWPAGFFEAIHITDPAFDRPDQGILPAVKPL